MLPPTLPRSRRPAPPGPCSAELLHYHKRYTMQSCDEEREVPIYACCSAGGRKWLWVAWDTSGDATRGEPAKAWGYEATADAAEAKAIEWAGPRAKPLPAKWASDYKRRLAVDARMGRPAKGISRPAKDRGGAARLEFLYCAHES